MRLLPKKKDTIQAGTYVTGNDLKYFPDRVDTCGLDFSRISVFGDV